MTPSFFEFSASHLADSGLVAEQIPRRVIRNMRVTVRSGDVVIVRFLREITNCTSEVGLILDVSFPMVWKLEK